MQCLQQSLGQRPALRAQVRSRINVARVQCNLLPNRPSASAFGTPEHKELKAEPTSEVKPITVCQASIGTLDMLLLQPSGRSQHR